MTTDPIADFLVALRNATSVRREKFVVPHSKMKRAILDILKREGVVADVSDKLLRGRKVLEIGLESRGRDGTSPEFVRVSKPGRRMYVKQQDIPRPLKGYGLVVVSTSQGVMTGAEARRKGLGGEVLFKEK